MQRYMLAGVLMSVGLCVRISSCLLWGLKYGTITPGSRERSTPSKCTSIRKEEEWEGS